MPTLYFNTPRYAKLPGHYAHAPEWLITRMGLWSEAIIESIVEEHGQSAVLRKLSDPLWFQIFGSVLGMDWHSSGITTSVMAVLKQKFNKRFKDLGIYICGGKGKYSRQTPNELMTLPIALDLMAQSSFAAAAFRRRCGIPRSTIAFRYTNTIPSFKTITYLGFQVPAWGSFYTFNDLSGVLISAQKCSILASAYNPLTNYFLLKFLDALKMALPLPIFPQQKVDFPFHNDV